MAVDVICLGELLIDFVSLDTNVSIMQSSGFKKAPGGAPANVAVGIKKLGLSSGFIGKVGKDPFGEYLAWVLQKEGVDTSYLLFDNYARTTLSFVAKREDGTRDCIFYRNPGADMLLSEDEISEEYIKGAKVFHFGSISLHHEVSKKATLKAIEYAKKHNLLISYDPNFRIDIWQDIKRAKEEMNLGLTFADIVKISDEEMEVITGFSSIEKSAENILEKGPKMVIITMGKEGCYYNDGKRSGYVKGFKVKLVDATGAGDAFVAAVLTKLIERFDGKDYNINDMSDSEIVEMLTFANAAGAMATTKIGAIPSLPTPDEVKKFIDTNKKEI